MRINRGLFGWGIFFIVLGAVPLAVRAGVVDEGVIRRAWELWPLILVGIGLGLLLRRTPIAIVGSVVVAVTFGLMAGSLVATGVGAVGGLGPCGLDHRTSAGDPFPAQSGTLAGTARVRLEMNCGSLDISAGDGTGWTVNGTSDGGRAPAITTTGGNLTLRVPERAGIDLGPWDWQVRLPREPSINLVLIANAGSARLDLAGMNVPTAKVTANASEARLDMVGTNAAERLDATANAGTLTLLLPTPPGTLQGTISVNAGSARICAPAGVALRLTGSTRALGSNNFGDRGLVHDGDAWSSVGFADATTRIDLSVSATLGSITLDPEDGCD